MSMDPESRPAEKPLIGLYGRARSKALKPDQQHLLDHFLPSLALPAGRFDPASAWPQAKETWLEVGFGAGEHFVHHASNNPQVHMIGFEPFQNGMAKALQEIKARDLQNVSVHMQDARPILSLLPDESLARVFVLYPDPWPKRRHWKRRIVEPGFITELARLLKPGGELRFVSDIAHYQQWALWHILQNGSFAWQAACSADWKTPPTDHITTRYEQKALREKRSPAYLLFQKKPSI